MYFVPTIIKMISELGMLKNLCLALQYKMKLISDHTRYVLEQKNNNVSYRPVLAMHQLFCIRKNSSINSQL